MKELAIHLRLYQEYKVVTVLFTKAFVHDQAIFFAGRLLALTDMLTMIIQDPE